MIYQIGRERNFYKALKSGKGIGRQVAQKKFNLANPSAAVLRFEEAGVPINRKYVTRVNKATKAKYTTVIYSIR